MAGSHPIHRRYFAEDLVRLRRADEQRRYFASQRAGRVDPNPHQIDAVIFALQRLPEGGCILADEVGLGKTIEAGLVIAQRRAEGARRILIVTPKPLLGQWREELGALFGIEAVDVSRDPALLRGDGVFLVGREYAGGEVGATALRTSGGFDLAVIDEAHEIFAGIYRRYDRRGQIKAKSRYASMAARVKALLEGTPVLLLTATPIQNTLTELWGLVQYVEPTGTLLGDLPTFRTLFCDGDDRQIKPGRDEELRDRIAQVCQRTLRRQAQEFMGVRFMPRHARLFQYAMAPDELALYEDVTAYLLEPDLCAFGGNLRRLLVLGFHRRMASSIRALQDSLRNVAERLRKQIVGDDPETLHLFVDDLEGEDFDEPPVPAAAPPPGTAKIRAELARVESFIARAERLAGDAKVDALCEAVKMILGPAVARGGSGKLVIFTEALSTQAYLREVLLARGLVTDEDVTLFRGDNVGARAQQALERWEAEEGSRMPASARPSRDVAVRMALVHEFRTRSKVFISTEAGAKGLNLQFCETVINYDLPWNPQRIEQRIGRCHRYGQTRPVSVVNFLNTDNAAQRHTFELLSRKLELFGSVLDASDAVLYEASEAQDGRRPQTLAGALGLTVQTEIESVYGLARSKAELESGLAEVGERIDEAREALERTYAKTAGLIELRLDETVRAAFARLHDEAPDALATLDRDLEGVLVRYLDAIGASFERHAGEPLRIAISAHPSLPSLVRDGTEVVIGRSERRTDGMPLHPGHALIHAALDEARWASRTPFRVRFDVPEGQDGRRGRLSLLKVGYDGFEPMVELVPVVVFEGDDVPLSEVDALALLRCPVQDAADLGPVAVDEAALGDAEQELLFLRQPAVDRQAHLRFEQAIERIERYMEDRIAVIRRARLELVERLDEAKSRRDQAPGADARSAAERECAELQAEIDELEAEQRRLQARDDDEYRTLSSQAHARRYVVPRKERILDVEFSL